jgi:hypothetical protein
MSAASSYQKLAKTDLANTLDQRAIQSQSQSQSYFTTDGQSVSMSWCRAQFGTFDHIYIYIYIFFLMLQSCLIWGALSDERSGLSFVSLQSVYSSQSVFT